MRFLKSKMKLQYLQLYFVVLCYVKLCRGQAPGDLQWWVGITTTAPDTRDPELLPFYDDAENDSNVCCECVPFYLCSDNNTIIVDGGKIIGPRIGEGNRMQNVESCPDVTQLCCRPPNAKVGCPINKTVPPIDRVTPNLNSSSCDCVSWELCSDDRMVSDGSSPTTIMGGTTLLQRHSKCPHSLEVCCAFDFDSPVSPPASPAPPAGGDCVCVNPLLCGKDGFIITEGTGGMDLRAIAPDGPPCVPPKLCCREPVGAVTPSAKVPPPRVNTTPLPPIDDKRCNGVRNRNGVSVRIGGFVLGESQFGEFPWAGMVLRNYSVVGNSMHAFIGGAMLINPRIMLTAAHKVANEAVASLTVRVGEWDIETTYEPAAHQSRSVESVIIHPNFNNQTLYHDVALLILKEPVVLHPHIRSICLATKVEEVDQSACVTNGWGEANFETGNYQTVMKSVTLPLVPSMRCQALLRRTRLGKWFQLHPSFICAGGKAGVDACSSDGGGPLACPRVGSTTEYLLVGITAWGIGCGEEGVPGVYASTMADNRWITAEVEGRFPSHSAVRRAVFDRAGGGLRVGELNLGPGSTQQDERRVTAAATTTTEEIPTTETSGKRRRPQRGQRHQHSWTRLDWLRGIWRGIGARRRGRRGETGEEKQDGELDLIIFE